LKEFFHLLREIILLSGIEFKSTKANRGNTPKEKEKEKENRSIHNR